MFGLRAQVRLSITTPRRSLTIGYSVLLVAGYGAPMHFLRLVHRYQLLDTSFLREGKAVEFTVWML